MKRETLSDRGAEKKRTEEGKRREAPTAIVTGASSGIGAAIVETLRSLGYTVYGLAHYASGTEDLCSAGESVEKCPGKPVSSEKLPEKPEPSENVPEGRTPYDNISKNHFDCFNSSENDGKNINRSEQPGNGQEAETERDAGMRPPYYPIPVELLETDRVLAIVEDIRKKTDLRLLVNCAGVAYYGLHETISGDRIAELCRVNLELPMRLSQSVLREFKEKCRKEPGSCGILNISSVTALHAAPHGAAYGATKAALLSFGRSLFEECRKHGVLVSTILPDLTDTALYRHADFQPDTGSGDCCLLPEDVAEAVAFILTRRFGVTLPELLLRPQKNRILRKNRPEKE